MIRACVLSCALVSSGWLVHAQGLPPVSLTPPLVVPPIVSEAIQLPVAPGPAAVAEPPVPGAQAVGCIRSPKRCSCFDQVGAPVPVPPGLCAQLTDTGAQRLAGGDLSRFEPRPVELVPDPVFPAPLPQHGLRYALDVARSIVGRR